MNNCYHDVTGYIIAGGKSTRMGFDKRQVNFEGQTLLVRSSQLISDLLGRPAYVVGDNLTEIASDQDNIIQDYKPGCGPISGLVSALIHCPTKWCLVLAVDLPFMQKSNLQILLEKRSDKFEMICLSKGKFPEPLAAIYAVQTREFWKDRLESGEYSMMKGIPLLKYEFVTLGPDSQDLENLNAPDDLDRI